MCSSNKKLVSGLVLFLLVLLDTFAIITAKKTIALFGIAGVGKSTLSNCLLNQRGEMANIQDGGFQVSEDAGSGTLKFDIKSNHEFTIVDTIGFGSLEFDASYVLGEMRKALRQVDFSIDCVVFVIKKGRLTNETFQFIRTFQQEVLRNASRANSVLLVNRCDKGWLSRPGQLNNPFVQQIRASCDDRVVEFDLKMDHSSDDDDIRRRNVLIRQRAIAELLDYFRSLQFARPVNVEHIKSDEFEQTFLTTLFAYLNAMSQRVVQRFQHFIDKHKNDGDDNEHFYDADSDFEESDDDDDFPDFYDHKFMLKNIKEIFGSLSIPFQRWRTTTKELDAEQVK